MNHFPECWRSEDHPSCRLAEIVRLQAEVRRLSRFITTTKDFFPQVFPENVSETVWCGGDEQFGVRSDAVAPFGNSPLLTGGIVKADLEHHGAGIQGANPAHITSHTPDRIPGSASWTAPCVDEPPTTLNSQRPHE